jgi:D-sedoheptulose 7-phosphate isomerase
MNASEFGKKYVERLQKTLAALPMGELDRIAEILGAAHRDGRTIFIIGNGGSAATASHMMNDFAKGTLGHNPHKEGSSEWKRFRVIALTDNVSLMTAWANDTDYNTIFSEPLKNLAQKDDVLLTISASGNSPNVIAAIEAAKKIGMKIVGFGGFGGGKMAKLADACFVVPSDEYGPVEDVHMILDHILTGYFYEKLREQHG